MADKFISLSKLASIRDWINNKLSTKQDTLSQGTGIKIDGNEISGMSMTANKGDVNSVELTDVNGTKLGIEFGEDLKITSSSPMLFGEEYTIKDAFVATYGQTSYADVKAAIDAKKPIVVSMTANNNIFCMTYSTYLNGGNATMYAVYKSNTRLSLATFTLTPSNAWTVTHSYLQEELSSGTNIKTVNNQSLLGEGNINIEGGGGDDSAHITVESWNQYQRAIAKIVNSLDEVVNSSVIITIWEDLRQVRIDIQNDSQDFQEWFYLPTIDLFNETTQNLQTQLGTLTDLTTDDKTSLVNAINEVYEKSGEPFRVKQWGSNTLNVTIPTCTSDISNTQIAKMVFSIDAVEGADYQIVGMIAYEVFDAATGGNRINCWPVCQFTGNGQKELSVRWMCGGTTDKVAKRINAWVLLKHR